MSEPIWCPCGKRCYSRRQAHANARRFRSYDGVSRSAYRCEYGGWHSGHTPANGGRR